MNDNSTNSDKSDKRVLEREQYEKLYPVSIHLDFGLWAIPSVVFIIAAGVGNLIIGENGQIIKSFTSFFSSLVGFLATLALLIAFEKYRSIQIEVQDEITQFEKTKYSRYLELFHKKTGLWLSAASFWMRITILLILFGYIVLLFNIFKGI